MAKSRNSKFSLAVLCGGPSLERGISLNSARSVCDHVQSESVEVLPIYFDHNKNAHIISRAQLYSSTPSDFDFKLQKSARELSQKQLVRTLKGVDLVFPTMHGPFGEDGQIQAFLEEHHIPFVGSSAAACRLAFDKYDANNHIAAHGFHNIPSLLLTRLMRDKRRRIAAFFKNQKSSRFIVKPATGGSSIAVYSVGSVDEALQCAEIIFSQRLDARVVVEPFCQGTEFTVIILENRFSLPVAILPTEIELDYSDYQIFDYRKKYLASRQVTYHCPPRFKDEDVDRIQIQAEQLFRLFGMRDFSRFDGWIFPDGKLYFSDFNPISGMEQNSFLFMQAARVGMSHRNLLRYVIQNACQRYGLTLPPDEDVHVQSKKAVHILFGGDTAERQVSLMTGTNVWLKLRRSKKYDPKPYLLDQKGYVWKLPYAFALNHTVEEILQMCLSAEHDEARLHRLKQRVFHRLNLKPEEAPETWQIPEKMSLKDFINSSECVFIGLHGGIGENGTLQKILEQEKISFNGPGSQSSLLCMDKYLSGKVIEHAQIEGVTIAKKRCVSLRSFRRFRASDYRKYWSEISRELGSETLIVKPVDDGCSAGVARLHNSDDLRSYVHFANEGTPHIPAECLSSQHGIIEMPTTRMQNILLEEFIVTDKVTVQKNKLIWEERSGWVEVTIGLLEEKGQLHALNPSITVAFGSILSLEEKFQGGTGINITPPPSPYVSTLAIKKARQRIEKVARVLGVEGYSRIDCFIHRRTGDLIVIEANTLPALSPATVIYHQALAQKTPLYPTQFLEKIVEHALQRAGKRLPKIKLARVA